MTSESKREVRVWQVWRAEGKHLAWTPRDGDRVTRIDGYPGDGMLRRVEDLSGSHWQVIAPGGGILCNLSGRDDAVRAVWAPRHETIVTAPDPETWRDRAIEAAPADSSPGPITFIPVQPAGMTQTTITKPKPCPKCRAIGPHDRETCFGRWLSTPHNDPPAAFVATVERTVPAPKFRVGEHVVVSGSPKITGDIPAQVVEHGARGYCLAYQSAAGHEGALTEVSEAHLRRPRKDEMWVRYAARELREAGRPK